MAQPVENDAVFFAHRSHRSFVRGHYTVQWTNSLLTLLVVTFMFGLVLLIGSNTGAIFLGENLDNQTTFISEVGIGLIASIFCVIKLVQHILLCRSGHIIEGEITKSESQIYNETWGVKITYRFQLSSGLWITSSASGSGDANSAAKATKVNILINDKEKFYVLL